MGSLPASESQTAADTVARVRGAFGVARLADLVVVEISGPDALGFLQNRLSNDVLALQPGQGQLNAALDRQGKIEGVFSLHRTETGCFLLSESAEVAHTVQAIEKYHIVENFRTEIRGDAFGIFSLQGPKAADWLAERISDLPNLPEYAFTDTSLFGADIRLVKRTLSGENGLLLLSAARDADDLEARLQAAVLEAGGVVMDEAVRHVLRVEAGIPRFGLDYDHETLLPETGLERMAVSYSKGCYLGQETIARIKTYGMVQRALTGLLFETDAELPPTGSPCRMDGKPVGTLQSTAWSPTLGRPIAMAYLGKAERVPGRELSLEIAGKPYRVQVTLLPFHDARARQRSGQELLQEGLKLFSDGFDEAAMRLLRQAIEREPGLVQAYEALGVILSRHERYDEAIALMNRILELDSDHVLAHTNLSVFYMKLGDKEKAEEEKAKATMAAFSKKAREAGLSFDPEAERRKKEQAARERVAMFEEALKFNPADPLGNFGLGSAYLELQEYEAAIAPFERTIAAQPKHTVAYLSLGKALEGCGRKAQAREAYAKGIEVAAGKGDLMPLKEMQARLENLDA